MAGASTSAMMAITDVNRHQVYPPALRYHIDVIMNPNIFFETLQSFHTTMGTRFMSLVLKKHYFKLLFHYEQVYYFRRQGSIVTPPFTVRQRSYPRFKFVNNSGQGMPLLRQPVFDQGSKSSGSVPNHLPLGESQPEDGMPLLHQPVFDQGSESSGSVPHHLPLGESQLEDDGNDHAASGDLPSDPVLGVDALNVAQSAPSNVADDGDATPSFVALSPSFRENEPIGVQSCPTNMAAQGIGENMLAGGMLVHNNLVTVNTGSHILHRERISMFKNLPYESMGQMIRLIEECWGRLTEAERGVYADQERMDRERYVRELNEYQERIRCTQSK